MLYIHKPVIKGILVYDTDDLSFEFLRDVGVFYDFLISTVEPINVQVCAGIKNYTFEHPLFYDRVVICFGNGEYFLPGIANRNAFIQWSNRLLRILNTVFVSYRRLGNASFNIKINNECSSDMETPCGNIYLEYNKVPYPLGYCNGAVRIWGNKLFSTDLNLLLKHPDENVGDFLHLLPKDLKRKLLINM